MEHAHRNLVVHRDLKPSNIAVGKDGVVKLLDFGIATLLEEEAGGDRPEHSRIVLLTPEEMDQAVKKTTNYQPPGR